MKTFILSLLFISISLSSLASGGESSGTLSDGSKGGSGTSKHQSLDDVVLTLADDDAETSRKVLVRSAAGSGIPQFTRNVAEQGESTEAAGAGRVPNPRFSSGFPPVIIYYQGETLKDIYFKMGLPKGDNWAIEQHKVPKNILPTDRFVQEALRQSKLTGDWSKLYNLNK